MMGANQGGDMVQALQELVTFDEFIAGLPESSEHRYELHRGVIVEMKPRGKHSLLAGDLAFNLGVAIRQGNYAYAIPKECIVRSRDGTSGYDPDVIVLDQAALEQEPRWERESIITLGTSVKLIVEVVSTNWRDDYLTKLRDYEELGIQEYWLADYAALGGRRFIGNPKRSTLTLCNWVDGEYELQQFRGEDAVISTIFPALTLTVDQIFAAAV
jgi:Uma2 family endonuclease